MIRRFKAHPQSAPGDFYVVNNQCLACGAPHVVAPDLIGWAETSGEYHHCIWKKQPETPAEMEQAVAAFDASEVECYRYGGNDRNIIARIGMAYCDHAGPIRAHRSVADVVVRDDRPIPISFTLTESQSPGLISSLIWAVASVFKRFFPPRA